MVKDFCSVKKVFRGNLLRSKRAIEDLGQRLDSFCAWEFLIGGTGDVDDIIDSNALSTRDRYHGPRGMVT
jgi:hypothetical protein